MAGSAFDDPLDFEFEEPIRISPLPTKKNKKKIIGLDDLLEDYEKEQERINKKKPKRSKIRKVSDVEDEFDDDANATEARLSEYVHKCEQEINQINGDEEIPFWGIQAFGDQETQPQKEHPELQSSVLLQSFMKHEINSLVELKIEKAENFFEQLLADHWLLQLVYGTGCVEKSIATWAYDLMLYSSKACLTEAASEFWCTILLKAETDTPTIKIDWLPGYSDLKKTLHLYGFLLDSTSKSSSDVDMVPADSIAAGPPHNIRHWIKFAALCCQMRKSHMIFSTQEAEELLVIIISLFLDRQLLGLSMVLYEGMRLVINSFGDEEWPQSCEEVAKSIAHRLPCDLNCLRVVECISGVDGRCKQLRSAVAFQFLVTCLDEKVCDAEEILGSLISINIKDKNCNLFKMYICLSLSENWLLFDSSIKDKAELQEMWGICLRNCSCGITITDLRPYASNVRSKASYLLQGSTSK